MGVLHLAVGSPLSAWWLGDFGGSDAEEDGGGGEPRGTGRQVCPQGTGGMGKAHPGRIGSARAGVQGEGGTKWGGPGRLL